MLKELRAVPLARLLLPFVAGIVFAAFAIETWQVEPKLLVCILLALSTAFLGLRFSANSGFRNRWVYGLAANIAIFCGGVLITLVNSPQIFPTSLAHCSNESAQWVLTLDETPVEKARSYKLEGQVLGTDSTGVAGKAIVYIAKSKEVSDLLVGDRILFQASLNNIVTPGNPNEFNYPRYLRFNKILKQAYVPAGNWIQLEPKGGFHPVRWLRNLRAHLLQQLDTITFGAQERAVIAALTLGYKQELDSETTNAFAVAGAMHVLAVSGLHVGILFMLVNWMLSFLDHVQKGRLIKLIITVLILFGYAALTGMSASVFRAATMFSFVAWGKSTKRPTNIYNTLAASALVLLIFDPYLIMQVGFQLSYAAVLGIVVIHPIIFNTVVFKNRMLDWAWNITCVSVAAQMATFPLGLLYFHQFPNYFLFSNLIVIPFATFIMYAGLFFFSVSWIPIVSTLAAFILKYLTLGLNQAVSLIEKLPYAITSQIDISVFETLLIYGFIITILLIIYQRQFRFIYLTASCVMSFIALQIIEANSHSTQQAAIIYNVRNGFAMDVIDGTCHEFVANESLLSNESSMLFHVEHHWWYRDLESPNIIMMDSLNPNLSLMNVLGNRVWLIPGHIQQLPIQTPDITIINTASDLNAFKQLKSSDLREVILASDLKQWKLEKWKSTLNELGIRYHSIPDSGPYFFKKRRPLIAEGP